MDPPELASEPAPCYAHRGRIEPPDSSQLLIFINVKIFILLKKIFCHAFGVATFLTPDIHVYSWDFPKVFKIQVFNALQNSNAIWPFKIDLSQKTPPKSNPKLKMKTSLKVLNRICPPQEPTSVGHCHYKKWS